MFEKWDTFVHLPGKHIHGKNAHTSTYNHKNELPTKDSWLWTEWGQIVLQIWASGLLLRDFYIPLNLIIMHLNRFLLGRARRLFWHGKWQWKWNDRAGLSVHICTPLETLIVYTKSGSRYTIHVHCVLVRNGFSWEGEIM